jgi:hypothetical protein
MMIAAESLAMNPVIISHDDLGVSFNGTPLSNRRIPFLIVHKKIPKQDAGLLGLY